MDKYTSDKYSLLGHSLRQCGFDSLEEYDKFKDELIAEMEEMIAQDKKNIFQKIGEWFNDLFSHSKKSN
ncbi:hypothetical protein [Geminocystis sp. NIES-3709]|uniref:hypothetical protein n=1 Tax=Geminocystis sp. NIES-3709 TaxID=1617448 RepID=UPI0005FC8136|nr:hypothetical protein [Geminocystis sp. NIES-3709]BAQ67114.1 hypothetical protein GM3709_3879 [Geminocystis sp. NIES-3709]